MECVFKALQVKESKTQRDDKKSDFKECHLSMHEGELFQYLIYINESN